MVTVASSAAFWFLLAAAAPAQTDADRALELDWQAPAGCPTAHEIRALVQQFVASRPPTATDVPARVTARVGQDAEGFRLDISIEADARVARRELVARSCADLARATALVIAVALDPVETSRQVEPIDRRAISTGDVADRSRPSPIVTEVVPVAPVRDHGRRPRPHLGFLVGGGSGLTPGFGGAVGLDTGARWRRASLEGGLRYFWPTTSQPFASAPAVGGIFQAWTIGLRACVTPRFGRIELPICAGAEAGGLVGTGIGTRDDRTRMTPYAAAIAGPMLAVAVSRRIALVAEVSTTVALVRSGFSTAGYGPIHRVPALGARFLLGVAIRFRSD